MRKDKDFGNSIWIEPSLDPTPNGWKEVGSTDDLGRVNRNHQMRNMTYEYPIQCFGEMRSSHLAGFLHMRLQIPKGLDSNPRNINDICSLCDRYIHGLSLEGRTQWEDECEHVLIQGIKWKEFG